MSGLDWGLELVLVGLLAIVLLHAIRLERAVTALRRDKGALGGAMAEFESSAREAQAGLGKLRHLTTEATGEVASRVGAATALRDDLAYLTERGGQVADRLETLVRAGRGATALRTEGAAKSGEPKAGELRPGELRPGRSTAERDLAATLQVARAERGRL